MLQADMAELSCRLHGLDAPGQRLLRALYRRSGIERRQSCLGDPRALPDEWRRPPGPTTAQRMRLYREHAPPLLLRACRDALAQPGAPPPEAVTHVIACSCTGFLAPGLDVLLARGLDLRPDVGRSLVGFQGCQAGLAGLRLAEGLCRADPAATVLVACVELSTLHVQLEPTEDNLLGNALFGDGAAAALVAGAGVPRSGPALAVLAVRTQLAGDSIGDMTWEVGDHGFLLHLSSLVPRLVGLDVRALVADRLGLSPDDVAGHAWAVHPGGAAILDAVQRSLELPPQALEASRGVLRDHGNMSSPTIWFVLRRLAQRLDPGSRVAALAFGPGLTVEAALLQHVP